MGLTTRIEKSEFIHSTFWVAYGHSLLIQEHNSMSHRKLAAVFSFFLLIPPAPTVGPWRQLHDCYMSPGDSLKYDQLSTCPHDVARAEM